jgi:hypothetical protein
MPRSVLNAYERGRREPGVDALGRVLAAAGCRLDLAPLDRRAEDERSGRVLSMVLDLTESLPSPSNPVPVRSTGRSSELGRRVRAVQKVLDAAAVSHAFGDGIALAYCGADARVTRLLEVHVLVPVPDADGVLSVLPEGVATRSSEGAPVRPGHVCLWWDATPVDLYFDVHDFSPGVARVPFEGTEISVLDCLSLAVVKATFGRPKDWVDIEAMREAGSLDGPAALGWVERLLGRDHPSYARLAALVG